MVAANSNSLNGLLCMVESIDRLGSDCKLATLREDNEPARLTVDIEWIELSRREGDSTMLPRIARLVDLRVGVPSDFLLILQKPKLILLNELNDLRIRIGFEETNIY